jgi:hypothetical protein
MVKQVYQASNSQNAIKKRESPQLNVRSNLDPIAPNTSRISPPTPNSGGLQEIVLPQNWGI